MKNCFVVALCTIAILAGAFLTTGFTAQQPATQDQGQLIPGCQIPKSYGRLVTIAAGNNTGITGQAVFEAEDGTIRWIALMFNVNQAIVQKPWRGSQAANFPALPLYECEVGHVWQRP